MKLNSIRKAIDSLDRELVQMIEARMELVLRSKRIGPLDAEREKTVIENALRLSHDLLEPEFAQQIFTSIIEESHRLADAGRKLVAFQGEHGAFSDVACRRLVHGAAYVPCLEFSDVFNGVCDGLYDFGVVPVENSLEGAVTQVNDLLTTTELKVIGEVVLPVHHCLLAPGDMDFKEIHMVYSHPQALAQCRGFLEANGMELRQFYDTAGAAKMVARERPRAAAAIASDLSAELYGLKILKEGIADNPSNSTRFLLLSKQGLEKGGDKCSIVFATDHQAGRLFNVLKLFAQDDINLTRIASMPRRSAPGNYTFFLDFEGSDKDETIATVLSKMDASTSDLRFLGCYPKATAS